MKGVYNIQLAITIKKQFMSVNCEEHRMKILNKLFLNILSSPIEEENNFFAKI